jgi:hypothetical protein
VFAAYFSLPPGSDLVHEILQELQSDEDRDVKFFSGGLSQLEHDLEISVLSPLSLDSSIPYNEQTSLHEQT